MRMNAFFSKGQSSIYHRNKAKMNRVWPIPIQQLVKITLFDLLCLAQHKVSYSLYKRYWKYILWVGTKHRSNIRGKQWLQLVASILVSILRCHNIFRPEWHFCLLLGGFFPFSSSSPLFLHCHFFAPFLRSHATFWSFGKGLPCLRHI